MSKTRTTYSGFILIEVLVASSLLAIVLTASFMVGMNTYNAIKSNRIHHQHDQTLAPVRDGDCVSSGAGLTVCFPHDQPFIVAEDAP